MGRHRLNYMANRRRDGSASFATAMAVAVYTGTLFVVMLVTAVLVDLLIGTFMHDRGPAAWTIIAILSAAVVACAYGAFAIVRDMYRGLRNPDPSPPDSSEASGADDSHRAE